MPPAGLEPAIPASEWPETYALNRAASVICYVIITIIIIIIIMWKLKCAIIPVKIGVTGIVTRSISKNLEAVPGKYSIDSLQKTAILGTSHIIRKVLQCEAWSVSGGDHRWFKGSTRKKCLWQETYILYNNNNLLQLGCYPVAVVILHAYKVWNSLLLNLSREFYMRSM